MNTESILTSLTKQSTTATPTNSAFYYLMKNGFILRLEQALDIKNIPLLIKANLLDNKEIQVMNQEQANYRVVIFRDEILEMPEYQERVFGIAQ
jgi:hypothetical protein